MAENRSNSPQPDAQTPAQKSGLGTSEARNRDDAHRMRQQMMTDQAKGVPLPRVMEELFGIAGEKSGPRTRKYWVDGLLFNLETDGTLFGVPGHKFRCFRGKGGSAGAIDLVIAVNEAQGRAIDFLEARTILQRHFLPHTLGDLRSSHAQKRIAIGDIAVEAWYHKDAVIKDAVTGQHCRVLAAPQNGDGLTTIECNEHGSPAPDAKPVNGCVLGRAASFGEPKDSESHEQILVHSRSGLLPNGISSTNPAVLLVPFGAFAGMMLGQLDRGHLDQLAGETRSTRLKHAIESAEPKSVGVGANVVTSDSRKAGRSTSGPVQLPNRVNRAIIGGREVDCDRVVRDYLINRRKLDPKLVEQVMASDLAYPIESIIYKKDQDGNKTLEVLHRNPAICFPIFSLQTLEPIAYQVKIIHLDPVLAKRFKGRDSINQGPVNEGFAMLGIWGPKTREAILTEAWIDGASFAQLRKVGPDTVILPTSGSRMPEELLAECKARGIKVRTAFDNDGPGRAMAKRVRNRCRELGVQYVDDVPGPSEFLLSLRDDGQGRERQKRTVEHCWKNQVMFKQEQTKNGWIRIRIDNTEETATWVDGLKNDDRMERQKVGFTEEQRRTKRVEVEVMNKDWNDLVVGGYQRTFTADFEREFYAGFAEPLTEEAADGMFIRNLLEKKPRKELAPSVASSGPSLG